MIAYSKSQPIEILERSYPILFEESALRIDSAGAGRFRGGLGYHFRVRLLRGEATSSFLMDKGKVPPHGILGGKQGTTTKITISQSGSVRSPLHGTKGSGFQLVPGDWIEVLTPGGGGFGSPADRDRLSVEHDLRCGYITEVRATTDYQCLVGQPRNSVGTGAGQRSVKAAS